LIFMKQLNTLKGLLLATCMGTAGVVSAQFANTAHPNAFTQTFTSSSGSTTFNNWYKDYVGTRLQVTQPSAIAGDYSYTTANDGSGSTAVWGGTVVTPIVDVPVYMGSLGTGSVDDSFGCTSWGTTAAAAMAGKIAVIWRGPLTGTGACEFGAKASYAQSAGAIAVVLINEYPGEGPVGMAAGALGASVTIPVFMIGNLDGIRIAAQYRTAGSIPGSVKMTITPWGKSLGNDLGFVPAGVSTWHNGAIPAKQLTASPLPVAYTGVDGAFIANYGLHQATNVKLATNLTFTPTGGSPTSIHTSTVTVMPTAISDTFPAIDSIYNVTSNVYNLSGAGLGTKGRYDMTYTITSDSLDQFNFDNIYTHSFYASDSVFSKGRYDFTNNHPIATLWTGGANPYMWGVPYYVAKGGDAIKDIQFSASTGAGVINPAVTNQNFYIFKWADTIAVDSIMESAELELVGSATYGFQPEDSSFSFFNTQVTSIDTSFNPDAPVILSDNTWYVIMGEVNGSTSVALGCDGIITQFPRSYGLKHFHNITELYNPEFPDSKDNFRGNPMYGFTNWSFSGAPYNVDSVTYSTQNGLIPAIAMRLRPAINGVNQVTPSTGKINVFPNPASEQLNVALDLDQQAKEVTFTIIDAAAHVVIKETVNNVKSDKFSFNTAKLTSGNYFIIVNADGKQAYRKFAIIK
jgi:hypothetical protein